MPTFFEVAQAAAREIEVEVRGIKFKILENLMVSPKAATATRERIGKLLKDTESAVKKARELKKANAGEDNDQEIEMVLASAKMQNSVDQREAIVEAVCSRIRSWDVLAADHLPLSLKEDELYKSECPTKFLQELLEAVDKEPIVPFGNASR